MGTFEIEGEGREAALAEALARLGLGEAEVDVETVEGGEGLLGPSPVRLRIRFDDGLLRARAAREALEELIRRMGMQASADLEFREGVARLDIRSGQAGLLIGRRGETLDALEHLVDRIVNRPPHERIRVVLDGEGYRGRAEERLRDLAVQMADKAKRTGQAVACKPMSARDRRIIHMALREDAEVETLSEGEGAFRRVVISPKP